MADGPLSAYDQLNNLYSQQIAAMQQRAASLPQPRGILANVDPAGLAMIAGLLKPSATGSFGENIANAAEAVQAPLSAMRKEQLDAQDKIASLQATQLKLAMEKPYLDARAQYMLNRGSGGGTTPHMAILQAKAFEEAADKIRAVNPKLAAQYDAQAKQLMSGLLSPEAISAGESVADPNAISTTEDAKKPGFFESMLADRAAEGPVTGADIAETIASERGVDTESRKKWLEQQKKNIEGTSEEEAAPAEPQAKAATTAAPKEEPKAESAFYSGDTPPKQFPNAKKADDGIWYVVKDGKIRPVLK